MSENEKKEEIKENVPITNNDKTTDIINSINAIVIPNMEEVSNKITTDEIYNIQKNNENYNAIDSSQNQLLSNNKNETIIVNINNNQNINTQINEDKINVNNNINNKETIINNNMNLYYKKNKYKSDDVPTLK